MKQHDIDIQFAAIKNNPSLVKDQAKKDLVEMDKITKGIPKVIHSIAEGSDANLRHQLKNALANITKLAEINKRQALLNIILSDEMKSKSDYKGGFPFGNIFGG